MSAVATVWAWSQQGLEPEEKLVLLALAEDANHAAQCWPTRAIMRERTGLSDERLADLLRSLSSKSLLQTEPREGKSAQIFLALQKANSVTQPAPRQAVVPFQPDLSTSSMMDQAMVIWNEMAARTKAGPRDHRLAPIRKLTDDMKRKLAPRLKEAGLEGWTFCVLAVEANAHCRGFNGWKADFHYLLQAQGFSKTMNGGWPADYEEKTNGGKRAGPAGRGDQRLDGLRSFDEAVRGRVDPRDGREGGGGGDRGDAGPDGGGEERGSGRLAIGGPDEYR